ncbi:MAG: ribonucleotide reductase subunit alpha [Eggerthellaceae bacterium]|jgi:hypothetical protein
MYFNDDANGTPNQNNSQRDTATDYFTRAERACSAGDNELGLHLYLAAYERAANDDDSTKPGSLCLRSLHRAWELACDLGERSLAEYVFEKLEPFLSTEETAACASQLQKLALDRLEEFGLSREELQDVADMISDDFMGDDARVVHIGSFTVPGADGASSIEVDAIGSPTSDDDDADDDEDDADDDARAVATDGEDDDARDARTASDDDAPARAHRFADTSAQAALDAAADAADEPLDYDNLVGYDKVVAAMRRMGVGMESSPSFREFVSQMNRFHGLDRMPPLDTVILASDARDDAMRFAEATVGELGLPALRLSMDDGPQGIPVLCVSSKSGHRPRLNPQHNRFRGPAVLILESIDEWISPSDLEEDADNAPSPFVMATMSRGAHEALELIGAGVEDPDVLVIATTSAYTDIDPYYMDMLQPTTVVSIGLPTDEERASIWADIIESHPSLRALDEASLVRYSQGMPRADLYDVARDAVEEAYKRGLEQRSCLPVAPSDLYRRLVDYHRTDSPLYREIEDAIVAEFEQGLDGLEEFVERSRDDEA